MALPQDSSAALAINQQSQVRIFLTSTIQMCILLVHNSALITV